jgi:hypothetical protein
MLHHHAIREVTNEHRRQREVEAEAHRLAQLARGTRRRRVRLELAKWLGGLLTTPGNAMQKPPYVVPTVWPRR